MLVTNQLRMGIKVIAAVAVAMLVTAFSQNSAAQEPRPYSPQAGEGNVGEEKFRQMAAVLQHPRCMNCHTRTEFPRQGG